MGSFLFHHTVSNPLTTWRPIRAYLFLLAIGKKAEVLRIKLKFKIGSTIGQDDKHAMLGKLH